MVKELHQFEEDSKANVELKTKEAARSGTPWTSIYLAGGCAFIQGAQFDMFSSSMWSYLKKLNPEAMETEFGHITALYSFGQCIISPAFGYWSNRIEQVRLPLLACFVFMMAGNFIYFLLEFFTRPNVAYVMMVARFIVGCGSGNMALLSAYAAMSSSKQDRARAIAFVNGGVAIGTVVGPGFQLLFTCLGPEGVHVLPFLRLNIYNTPALFATLLNITGFLAISFMFQENYDVLSSLEKKDTKELPPPSLIAVLVCVSTRFVQVFVSATIGTLESAFSMLMFSFNKEEAVTAYSSSDLAAGLVSIGLYFVFIFFDLKKWVPKRISTVLVMCLYACLFLFTFPWSFLPSNVEISVNGSDRGCVAERFSWCIGLKAVSPFVYYPMIVLVFGVGDSIISIALTTLYSEIIGPRRQGTLQGVLQMSGSIGSMLAPLISSTLYTEFGPQAPWSLAIAEISMVVALWLVFHKKMVTLRTENMSVKSTVMKES
ncbi:hypothetical protein V3C99_010582 [Haemonchus contortus]